MQLFLDLFFQGGMFIIPLLICSVLVIAITLDRFIHLRTEKIIRSDLLIEIEDAVNENRFKEVLKITAEYDDTPMMRIARVAILNCESGYENLKTSIEEAGRLEIPFLEKYLTPLNTIAVISPLLGLLGTVTGMIKVFSATMGDQSTSIENLAIGISEALVTTAAGLIVALPTIIAHSYFSRRVEILLNLLEKNSLTLFNIITKARSSKEK